MESILKQNVSSLRKIGKSNNSHIYLEINSSGQALENVLKIIVHKEKGKHSPECFHLHNEHKILSELNHPNIIKMSSKLYNSVTLQKNEICCMELELAECDLYDHMSKIYPKKIKPIEIRNIFQQIARSIEYLHSKNISHNDIKLENIFLFENFKIAKIADFGFSNRDQVSGVWKNRTKTMLAPEILEGIRSQNPFFLDFDEQKSDIFALGITIFQSLLFRLPFEGEWADSDDKMYLPMYQGNHKDFWQQPDINKIMRILDKSNDFRKSLFIDLMNKMLATNPKDRINIQQVVGHPWFSKNSNKTRCIFM